MEKEKFIACFDMLAMNEKEFKAAKRFFEGYDGLEFCNGEPCANINVSCVTLSCDKENTEMKKLISGFVIIFHDEMNDPGWSFLEEIAPGISEFKDNWRTEKVERFWKDYCEFWNKFDSGEIEVD